MSIFAAVLIILNVVELALLVRFALRRHNDPGRPDLDPAALAVALEATTARLEAVAAGSAVNVAADLTTAAAGVAHDLRVAAELQNAHFTRLDVLLDRLTDAVDRAREEAGDEAERVAGNLADRTAEADAAEAGGGGAGSAADAGARTPPAGAAPARKRRRP